MTAAFEDSSPTYLSARSSDVILSDIRPIKLKVEALRSVNAFLDELLWTILNTSRSLATDRIKASLLKIIPTTLGKEALLEAEVELKAYWERTNPKSKPVAAEGEEFPLQWSFELLRFKCEAYSTLNDSDEDINAETRLSERMRESGYTSPPPLALVAPAALYLTAIIEYVCEHILSNVSRVIARDSSRTMATPDDLFVALCEDGTMYNTFKSMKVYDQIEHLLKSARHQRSKSFSRDKIIVPSRTPSLHSDLSVSIRETTSTHTQSRLRMSSDSLTTGVTATQTPSRSSMEKNKMKIFLHGRTSSDHGDSSNGNRRTESSEGSKGYDDNIYDNLLGSEEQILKDEFDELMRSGSTMKVSLTPDRLKSMEVYNKEKNKRGTRRSMSKSDGSKGNHDEAPTLPENDAKRPHQLNLVDSIVEDEEYSNTGNLTAKATLSARQLDIPSTSYLSEKTGRTRSLSASQASQAPSIVSRKSSWNSSLKTNQTLSRRRDLPGPKHLDLSDKSSRTRKVQHQIENMDIDDIMNGSDVEMNGSASQPPSSYKGPTRAITGRKVSSGARDLINFLDEGPPENIQSTRIDDMTAPSLSKSKSGRLQRMILRLKGGSSTERLREEPSTPRRAAAVFSPETPKSASLPRQSPHSPPYVSVAKNYPNVIIGTPPRPPPSVPPVTQALPPITPPDDKKQESPPISPSKLARKAVPSIELVREAGKPVPPSRQSSRTGSESLVLASAGKVLTNGHANGNAEKSVVDDLREFSTTADGGVVTDQKQVSKCQVEASTSVPLLTTDRVDQLRCLLTNATTADECRVLVDMFLARIGFPVNRAKNDDPYALPTPDPKLDALESSVIEALLDGTAGSIPLDPAQVEASERQNTDPSLSTVSFRSEPLTAPKDTQLRQHPPQTLVAA